MNTKFATLINSEMPVLIDFHNPSCQSCQMLESSLERVKECLNSRISVIKIDVGRNSELVKSLSIRRLPTMLLFRKGKQLWRQSGLMSTEEIISKIIEKYN